MNIVSLPVLHLLALSKTIAVITFRREEDLIWSWHTFAWGKVLYLFVSFGLTVKYVSDMGYF